MNWQCDLEYRGEDFTSAVTFGNPDVLVGSGMIISTIIVEALLHMLVILSDKFNR